MTWARRTQLLNRVLKPTVANKGKYSPRPSRGKPNKPERVMIESEGEKRT